MRVFVLHGEKVWTMAGFGGGGGWREVGASLARMTGPHPPFSSGSLKKRRNARTDKSTCTLPASQFLPSDLAARRFGGQGQEQGVEWDVFQ